jgi:hypothetical protein
MAGGSAMRPQFNLVLVIWEPHQRIEANINQIAKRVTELDPHVRAFVVRHRKIHQLKLARVWSQPTLSLSFYRLLKRKLLPGRFLSGSFLYKHGEYRRLDAAGIPVPRWTVISPDTQLDPTEWGPYVVEKPTTGRRGAQVRIRKTGRVRYAPPETLPEGHLGRDGPMLAQRFIYTGEWPTSYRVFTLFGDVLLCYRQVTNARGQALKGRWRFAETGGVSIVSNTLDMNVELIKDDEVIQLAERAHREAFPDFPVLAFDIVRDAETGACYVLECHAQGAWPLSDSGTGIEAANGLDFTAQFNLVDRAAAILARETVARAAVSWPPLLWGGKA